MSSPGNSAPAAAPLHPPPATLYAQLSSLHLEPDAVYELLIGIVESVLAQLCNPNPHDRSERAEFRTNKVLSSRESEILRLVARGMSNKRIAHALGIAPETVKSHVKRIFIKLDVRTRAEAVARANVLGTTHSRNDGANAA